MCNIAEELERIGMEKGIEISKRSIEKGIRALITDCINSGIQKEKILEKVGIYFSITMSEAEGLYNEVVMG